MCRFRVLQNGGIREIVVSHFLAQTLNRGVEDIKKVVLRFNSFFLSFFLSFFACQDEIQAASAATTDQCDHIWKHFATLAKC